jgi:hypothetical protein
LDADAKPGDAGVSPSPERASPSVDRIGLEREFLDLQSETAQGEITERGDVVGPKQ